MHKTSVEIIDDHAVVRAGVRMLIDYQIDMQVVAEASNAFDGINLAHELAPEVVLLDIGLPRCSGLDAIAPLLQASPKSRVLMLTTHNSQAYLRLAISEGAAGFLVKNAEPTELTTAIRTVASGRSYISVQLSGKDALKPVLKETAAFVNPPLDVLSTREKRVLTLVASGYTNQEVAQELGLGVKSIETYRFRLNEKLGFTKKTELVRFALESGLLTPDLVD